MMSAETFPSRFEIGVRNLGTVVFLLIPLTFLIRTVPLPGTENFDTVSYLFSLLFVGIGVYALRGLMRRGKVIQSLGYHPTSYFMLGCCGLMIVAAVSELITDTLTPSKIESLTRVFSMSFGFGACHIAGRSVCERGIWFMGSLLRWDRIENYTWNHRTGEFLYEIRRNWSPWKYGFMTIPVKHQTEFAALVEQSIGEQEDAESDDFA